MQLRKNAANKLVSISICVSIDSPNIEDCAKGCRSVDSDWAAHAAYAKKQIARKLKLYHDYEVQKYEYEVVCEDLYAPVPTPGLNLHVEAKLRHIA